MMKLIMCAAEKNYVLYAEGDTMLCEGNFLLKKLIKLFKDTQNFLTPPGTTWKIKQVKYIHKKFIKNHKLKFSINRIKLRQFLLRFQL